MKTPVLEIIKRLKKACPGIKTPLHFSNPMEILVATILSAQCTDERVNRVTESLFKKYRTVSDYAQAEARELEQDIRPTGFFRNKAANIIASARLIRKKFGGRVPSSMESILELPGVARKTANVVLGNAYGVVEGIAVDTHVRRVTQRLGLTRNDSPEKIEQDLMKTVPRKDWFVFPLLIQRLGREVCRAARPEHGICVLRDICPSAIPAHRHE
ncbi:MAG: endonuclease III [Endomicrobiales bacterium]